MRGTIPLSRRRLVALVIVVIALTASVGTYIHDNPLGITPIGDINAGTVAVGESVTIKGRIVGGYVVWWGTGCDGDITVTDGTGNITLPCNTCGLGIGDVIIVRGTVYASIYLSPVEWIERVWLFA